jgi:hypothetical protein
MSLRSCGLRTAHGNTPFTIPRESNANWRFRRARPPSDERQELLRLVPRLIAMFFFYSNGVDLAGSIIASLLLSAVQLYACSGP